MPVTITLNPDWAERWRVPAPARRLSVPPWALASHANASEHPDHPETCLRSRFRLGPGWQ